MTLGRVVIEDEPFADDGLVVFEHANKKGIKTRFKMISFKSRTP